MNDYRKTEKQIRRWVCFFIIALVLSGITAFPLETELHLLDHWSNEHLNHTNPLKHWINYVYEGIQQTNRLFPYIAYGTDWLAFSHCVIAVFFIGLYIDPVRNQWILQAGMIACLAVIPLALTAGEIRQIPWFWRFIDCSFGILGIIPLMITRKLINKLSKQQEELHTNQLYTKKGVLE